MDLLKKEKKEKFAKQFSKWDATLQKNKVTNLEALYKKIHADIRKGPKRVKTERKNAPVRKVIGKDKARVIQDSKGRKWLRHKKLNIQERKDRVKAKIQKAISKK
jgi:hypothetical protein